MIILENLTMHYGPKVLFDNVNLMLKDNQKYGIVGANGAGKSTFLRLVTGDEEANTGQVTIGKNQTIGSLKQDQFKYENTRIIDVIIKGNEPLWDAIHQKEHILAKEDISDAEGFLLGELETIIADNDGYDAESRAEIILNGLGIEPKFFQQPLKTLSGGYKIRVLLGQSLFANPDILLLDEPNNHLDILSIQWLEDFLINNFKGLLLLISHDHDFLNRVCDNILDVDYKNIVLYPGNYDYFVKNKSDIAERTIKERDGVEKRLKKDQEFIDRFRAGTRSRQAASREKQLQKVELPEIKVSTRVAPKFDFKQQIKSGKEAVVIESLSKSFGEEKKLFTNVSMRIERGEKIAILGKNGIGKSTFLKTMLGLIKADSGKVTWGHNSLYSYFSQDHHDMVTGNMNAYQWLEKISNISEIAVLRKALAQMLFRQEDVEKLLSVLSGGETARLLFTYIILKQANIIILDEPTNHLDLESREALGNALHKFEGTVIFVSHDRNFIKHVAQRIIFLHERGIVDFKGSYQDFRVQYHKFFE